MAIPLSTPTNNPVPSTDIRDHVYAGAMLDKVVTSLELKYVDRLGGEHLTIEGLRQAAQEAISAFGWVPVGTFQDGAVLTLPNQILKDNTDGEYYRWDGVFPKTVPVGSTPSSSGGVGSGAWLSVGDVVLRDNLASSEDGEGDALLTVKAPFTGGTARTQHEKNQDTITPEDFGAIGDGTVHPLSEKYATLAAAQAVYPFVTALTQSIDFAALQAVLNTGKPFKIISQLMVSDKITSASKNVVIRADGVGHASVKFTTISGGFDFTFKSQDTTPPQIMSMEGFQIYTDVAVTTPAIRANWGARVPNASGQCWINNMQIHSGNSTSGSFDAGIDLIYCFGAFINNVKVLGNLNRTGLDGYRIQGCVEIHVTNSHANRYNCPARVMKHVSGDAQSEGIFFNQCFLYDCNSGFMSTDQAIHINLIGTFINNNGTDDAVISNVAAISLSQCSQYTIIGCLLYVGGNSTDGANQDGIRIADGSGGTISDNQIIGLVKANCRYGVVMSGAAIYGRVSDNKITTFTNEGIYITASTARGNHLVDNYLYDVSSTTPITDSGTGTVRSGNVVCAALDSPKVYDPSPIPTGGVALGTIGGSADWGAFIWPNNGGVADLAIADSAGSVVAASETGRFGVRSYAKASLPSAAYFGGGCMGLIGVNDDIGGVTLAFSDGTNWRRVADRAVIS